MGKMAKTEFHACFLKIKTSKFWTLCC